MSIKHADVMIALENILGQWDSDNISVVEAKESLNVLVMTSKLIKEDEQYVAESDDLLAHDKEEEAMSLFEARQKMQRIVELRANDGIDTKKADDLMRFLNMYCNSFKTNGLMMNTTIAIDGVATKASQMDEVILDDLASLAQDQLQQKAELAHAKRQVHVFLSGRDHEWDQAQEERWQQHLAKNTYWWPRSRSPAVEEEVTLKPLKSRQPASKAKPVDRWPR